MDWIRRNWPDLLIGLALLAVIAGIIATLLNGGSFFPGRSSTSTAPPAATGPLQPGETTAPPDTTTPAATGATDTTATGAPNTNAATTGTADANTTPTDTTNADIPTVDTAATDATSTDTAATGTADANTTDGNGNATDVPVISSSGSEATPATSPDTTTTTAPATNETTTAPATTNPAGVTSRNVSDVEFTYRILIDSFSSAENAQRRAQVFEEAGFPTFTATQNDLTLVLVGPFDTQSEADSAFSRIQSEGLKDNPLLFTPAGSDAATNTATTSTTTSDGAAAATTTATPATFETGAQTADSSTTSGESYLQTGAYVTSESAQPQRERLEGLGFNVSEVTEGSFVKLLVGPFSGDELAGAESRLSAQGIDYFVRSN